MAESRGPGPATDPGRRKPAPDGSALHLPGLCVRPARPEDAPAIRSLLAEAEDCRARAGLAARPDGWTDRVLGRILRDPAGCWMADYRGAAVGHISCWQDEMLGVIGSHAVSGPYQGLGVGGALLTRAVCHAREEGLRLLEASLHARMDRALHLYERHGFRRTGSARADGWNRYERRLGGPT